MLSLHSSSLTHTCNFILSLPQIRSSLFTFSSEHNSSKIHRFQVELTAVLAAIHLKDGLRSRVFLNDNRSAGNAKLPDVWDLVIKFGDWEVPCTARLAKNNFEVSVILVVFT